MIQHDLTPAELQFLVSRCKDGKSNWKWINHEGCRLRGPRLRVEAGQISEATCDSGQDAATVVRAVHHAELKRHERRSRAAKEAAETRRRRKKAQVYRIAESILLGGEPLKPAKHCQICGRAVWDPPSEARGIGSDCWQDILRAIEHMKRERGDGRPTLLGGDV